jgi:hypothetical protein
MIGRHEQCLQLRDQAAGYIRRFLLKRGLTVEQEYLEQGIKMSCRPDDGRTRSLMIVAYWAQGFYVWVAWKGEDGAREDVHVSIGNEPTRRKTFPEFDHLLAEL